MDGSSQTGTASVDISLRRKSRKRRLNRVLPGHALEQAITARKQHGLALQRAVDVVISGTLLILLSPLLAVVAVLVKLTSVGPVFYSQTRVGQGGRIFTIFKFRSMHINAEGDVGPVWADDADPRCTPIGGMLRRFGIDELPQLWNVLRGDMSLVGPRPERPFFVQKFSRLYPEYPLRHAVRPGITGWAQVNGWRGNTSLEERLQCDLYFAQRHSLGLYLVIMLRTPMALLFPRRRSGNKT